MGAVVARRHSTARAFLDACWSFLLQRESEHCLLLGICAGLPDGPLDPDGPLLATAEAGGEVVGAAFHAGPFDVVLSHLEHPDAVPGLCELLLRSGRDVPGVFGAPTDARAFAARWTDERGGRAETSSEERIHRLRTVIPPETVAGGPRPATPADGPLLARWVAAFHEEASGRTAEDPDAALRWFLESPGASLHLWVHDGEPVSMAGVQGPTPSGIRVTLVYTPVEHRRHGYASNLVAHVSQAQLDVGRREAYLYTDLANPTANRIYARIGFEPVADVVHLRFVADGDTDRA